MNSSPKASLSPKGNVAFRVSTSPQKLDVANQESPLLKKRKGAGDFQKICDIEKVLTSVALIFTCVEHFQHSR